MSKQEWILYNITTTMITPLSNKNLKQVDSTSPNVEDKRKLGSQSGKKRRSPASQRHRRERASQYRQRKFEKVEDHVEVKVPLNTKVTVNTETKEEVEKKQPEVVIEAVKEQQCVACDNSKSQASASADDVGDGGITRPKNFDHQFENEDRQVSDDEDYKSEDGKTFGVITADPFRVNSTIWVDFTDCDLDTMMDRVGEIRERCERVDAARRGDSTWHSYVARIRKTFWTGSFCQVVSHWLILIGIVLLLNSMLCYCVTPIRRVLDLGDESDYSFSVFGFAVELWWIKFARIVVSYTDAFLHSMSRTYRRFVNYLKGVEESVNYWAVLFDYWVIFALAFYHPWLGASLLITGLILKHFTRPIERKLNDEVIRTIVIRRSDMPDLTNCTVIIKFGEVVNKHVYDDSCDVREASLRSNDCITTEVIQQSAYIRIFTTKEVVERRLLFMPLMTQKLAQNFDSSDGLLKNGRSFLRRSQGYYNVPPSLWTDMCNPSFMIAYYCAAAREMESGYLLNSQGSSVTGDTLTL